MKARVAIERETLGKDAVAGLVLEPSEIPRSLPVPVAPVLRLVPSLIIPALSLASRKPS